MKKYIDREKFMANLEADKYGFTSCAKVGAALDKASVELEKEIEKAIELLKAEYEEAKKQEWVYNPLAYALYHTWKKVDEKSNNYRKD